METVAGGVGRDSLAKFLSEFGHFTADGLVPAQQAVIRHGVKLRNTRRHLLIILPQINMEINELLSYSDDRSEAVSSQVQLDTKRSFTSPTPDKTCTQNH